MLGSSGAEVSPAVSLTSGATVTAVWYGVVAVSSSAVGVTAVTVTVRVAEAALPSESATR